MGHSLFVLDRQQSFKEELGSDTSGCRQPPTSPSPTTTLSKIPFSAHSAESQAGTSPVLTLIRIPRQLTKSHSLKDSYPSDARRRSAHPRGTTDPDRRPRGPLAGAEAAGDHSTGEVSGERRPRGAAAHPTGPPDPATERRRLAHRKRGRVRAVPSHHHPSR